MINYKDLSKIEKIRLKQYQAALRRIQKGHPKRKDAGIVARYESAQASAREQIERDSRLDHALSK